MTGYTLAELCVVACAEAWRGDGEILAHGTDAIPRLGVGLAKLTFSPDLLLLGGWCHLVRTPVPLGTAMPDARDVEGWMPVEAVFDLIASGRRHAMMGAAQLDRRGNSNISCIGDWKRPHRQLIGARGVPGNTVNHVCSYWVPNHSPRVLVDAVDFVCGVGPGEPAADGVRGEIRRVVTNLGVFDFAGPGGAFRVVSVHPGVTLPEVVAATGFPVHVADDLHETREPTPEELRLIRTVLDPDGHRPQV